MRAYLTVAGMALGLVGVWAAHGAPKVMTPKLARRLDRAHGGTRGKPIRVEAR